jgi:hypothetical protein
LKDSKVWSLPDLIGPISKFDDIQRVAWNNQ